MTTLQEGERKWVRGRKSGPASRSGRGKKLGLEISHFKSGHKEARKRNGRQFSLGGEFSRLNIASLALASMDMTPVVWRPRRTRSTETLLQASAEVQLLDAETLFLDRIKFNTDLNPANPRTIYVSNVFFNCSAKELKGGIAGFDNFFKLFLRIFTSLLQNLSPALIGAHLG